MKCLRTEEYVQQLSCVKDTVVLHDELKVKSVFYVAVACEIGNGFQ